MMKFAHNFDKNTSKQNKKLKVAKSVVYTKAVTRA